MAMLVITRWYPLPEDTMAPGAPKLRLLRQFRSSGCCARPFHPTVRSWCASRPRHLGLAKAIPNGFKWLGRLYIYIYNFEHRIYIYIYEYISDIFIFFETHWFYLKPIGFYKWPISLREVLGYNYTPNQLFLLEWYIRLAMMFGMMYD